MLVVISPAKRLNFAPEERRMAPSEPTFQEDALTLSRAASRLSVAELGKLMSISEDLARLNKGRFSAFSAEPEAEATKPAALAFAGDTYLGLEAASLDAEELAWAQDHLRILSGLYGLLRPMDLIQPYRLEMGSRLRTRRGEDLYRYWGDRLARQLNALAVESKASCLVNCASVEYFKAVPEASLDVPIVTPVFLEEKNGTEKIVSFFAKKARGAMARFIVQNRLTDAEGLRDFDAGGYRFQPDRSTAQNPVFVRPQLTA